ncbi:MAG TPA: thiopurine S-methyltransferase [Rhodanobacter sp.]|jgi:thiopurine S-methyltransferase|nr:thiopurine S-methyltransferase [Rhodanobacter sp.]
MLAAYWSERWREGRTGWHSDQPSQLLLKHWQALAMQARAHVLVPLCGKSPDLLWLAAQRYLVTGVELSPLAVEQFFAENHLTESMRDEADGRHWTAESIEIINGDIFDLRADAFADFTAVYDRAALVALPPRMRERYVSEVYGKLPSGCHGLLITMDYPPLEMDGPPFSVDDDEVHRLFDPAWDIDLLERQAVLSSQSPFSERGVTKLHMSAYKLFKRAA